MAGTRNYQSIGEVLVAVKTEFPDITISKIRFLESEGLIEPERTPSGYRKFYPDDVERLRSILRMQRDEYLPLKVIKERLLQQDAGPTTADVADGDAAAATAARRREDLAEAPTGLQMSLEEMSAATGVDRDRIKELEAFGIVCSHGPEGGRYYDGDDYIVLSIVKDFLRYGIEPRHLTMYKHFAERESSFFEALVAPTLRQKNPDARRAAAQTLAELDVHVAEVQAGAAAQRLREHLAQRVSAALLRRRVAGRRRCLSLVVLGPRGARRARSRRAPGPPPDAGPARRAPSPFPQRLHTPRDPRPAAHVDAAARDPGRSRHRAGPVRASRRTRRGRSPASRR